MDGTTRTALIVGRNPDLLEVIDEILQKENYKTEIILTEWDLNKRLSDPQPDIVIADYGRNGGKLYDFLMEKIHVWDSNLVVITTQKTADPFESITEVKKNSILVMPFNLDNLLEVL